MLSRLKIIVFVTIIVCYQLIETLSAEQPQPLSVSQFHNDRYLYETKTIQVPLDHFNKAVNGTFGLRYLYNDTFVGKNKASPIFFYTGNEGDIETFAQNTGFLWEAAIDFKALVVFAEHRYYGKSLPFGDATFNTAEHYGYLSVEQALEDFVQLITFLNPKSDRPVIAFGGSYGGMLSAWLRIKYPHIVTGALAASAPVWQFQGLTPCDMFSKILTSIYQNSLSANCSLNIQNSWNLFKKLGATDEGRKKLNETFNFCTPLKQEKDVDAFMDFLEDVYANLAMANYPYANEFLAPLPAYPVRQFCMYLRDLLNETTLLAAMKDAINVYTNFTGTEKCLKVVENAADIGGPAWDIQVCNQLVLPMCSPANETMFRESKWDFKEYSNKCFDKFKIRPELNDIVTRYGGRNLLEYSSNIIFSNGLLDPWSGGGVLSSNNNLIYTILIPEGAHHLDLRAANENDPNSVVSARLQERQIMKKWMDEFYWLHKLSNYEFHTIEKLGSVV